jgi:poly-gamma-glutamate capsule biosynthesis protein CapA/YwtB (metallophosphatase superfamily)
MKKKWYHHIRYEYQRWPLSRFDLNLGYICKSIDHVNFPQSVADAEHYKKMHAWLANASWRSYIAGDPAHVYAVGDLMWIRSGWSNSLSDGIKNTLKQADLTIANLETPVDPAVKVPKWVYETFHYNAPQEYLSDWHKLKPDAQHVFSICNNHALDQGYSGLQATRNSVLQHSPDFHCLGGMNAEDDTSLVMVKGIRMGFMASTYGINHLAAQTKAPDGIPMHLFGKPDLEPDWKAIAAKISKLVEQGAEYIIYTPHWGYEYEYWPEAIQRSHALKLIEMGVDVILGHSPHVIQPIELISINNMDPACPLQVQRPGAKGFGIIAWSLGNFLTIMPTRVCKTGVILKLELIKKDGVVHIKNLRLQPVYCSRPPTGKWLDRQAMCLHELPAKKAGLRPDIIRHCATISPLISTGE